jgi:hypothetical protein
MESFKGKTYRAKVPIQWTAKVFDIWYFLTRDFLFDAMGLLQEHECAVWR